MKQWARIYPLAGVLAAVSYAGLTLAAYLQFPGLFTPVRNWLSDLGDVNQNPAGAGFYNLGIVITGALILLSFLSFSQWRLKNRRIQNLMVGLTQLFGILGSLALMLSAVFPINVIEQHRFMSISLYILLGTAFVFSVFAIRYLPGCPKWVLALGGITALVDILSGVFHEVTLLEWMTVALFLGYVCVLSVNILPAFRNLKMGTPK